MYLPSNKKKAITLAEQYLSSKYQKDFLLDSIYISYEPGGYYMTFKDGIDNNLSFYAFISYNYTGMRENYMKRFMEYSNETVIAQKLNLDVSNVMIISMDNPPDNFDNLSPIDFLKNSEEDYSIIIINKDSLSRENISNILQEEGYSTDRISIMAKGKLNKVSYGGPATVHKF